MWIENTYRIRIKAFVNICSTQSLNLLYQYERTEEKTFSDIEANEITHTLIENNHTVR